MKHELIKNITPIIEKFADDVLSSFSGLEQIRKNVINQERKYQDLNEEREKELKEIKFRKTQEREESNRMITALENAKKDSIIKAKSYEKLTNDLKVMEKEKEDNLAKSKIELIRAKEVRAQADEKKIEAEKVKSDYELKLNSLKLDSDRIKNNNLKLEDELKKIRVRENDIFVNESKNNTKAQELNDQELSVKAERKEINRLIELYKLKQVA